LDGLVLRIAGLPAESGPEVEEPDLQCYQPSMTCVIQRTAAGEPALSSKQQQQLLDHGLKFILFFGAGEVPQGLSGCAELGVWRFTRSSGAAKLYPFIHGLHRRDDVVSFGLEQVSEQEGRRRILLNGHFRARGERNRSVATQILSEASRWHARAEACPAPRRSALLRRYRQLRRWAPTLLVLFLSLFSRDAVVQLASSSHPSCSRPERRLSPDEFQALLAGAPLSDVTLLPRLKEGTTSQIRSSYRQRRS
jgi:hypothetical protein